MVGGYAIFDVPSKDAMIECTTRFMELHQSFCRAGSEAEIRQLAGPGEKMCDQAREMRAAEI